MLLEKLTSPESRRRIKKQTVVWNLCSGIPVIDPNSRKGGLMNRIAIATAVERLAALRIVSVLGVIVATGPGQVWADSTPAAAESAAAEAEATGPQVAEVGVT